MGPPRFRLLATTLLVPLVAAADAPRDKSPLPPTPAPATAESDDSWIESVRGSVRPGSWVSEMTASFRVPRTPSSGGQVLYFFPGLQPPFGRVILQPVLRYQADGWAILSERYHRDGDREVEDRSTVVPTAPGHVIVGRMRSSACNRSGVCTWTITTSDLTSGESTTLTEEDYVPYTTYFAGVLEGYGVTRCSQYPDDGSIRFFDVTVYDEDGRGIPIGRDEWIRPRIDPWCHFGSSGPPVAPTDNAITLYFGTT
jgi:hypothetical protein